MRFYGLAVMIGVVGLSACAGGDKRPGDTTAVGVDTSAAVATVPASGTGTPVASGAMAPITGTTHEVKMIGDAQGYRFEPAELTIKVGDGVKFTTINGGPHNVAFDPAKIPADVQGQLDANISEKMGQLASALKMNAGESVTVSFAGLKPGEYYYFCTPHLALGMKGEIKVQ